MAELQQPDPAATGLDPTVLAPSRSDEGDYALGCECAFPTLQIESWGMDASGTSADLS